MALPCYMAMTSAEFTASEIIPAHPAWMACHFSSYGNGLSNMPGDLPPGSMIILNDEMPINGHQPDKILQELKELYEQLQPGCFLLDFERRKNEENARLAKLLCEALPCPVGISHLYAEDLDCPVFLPPPPLLTPMEKYLSGWAKREVWLEISQDRNIVTLTEDGAQISYDTSASLHEPVFLSKELACRYHIQLQKDRALFYIERDLELYKQEAERYGVSCLVGLYQQLNEKTES